MLVVAAMLAIELRDHLVKNGMLLLPSTFCSVTCSELMARQRSSRSGDSQYQLFA